MILIPVISAVLYLLGGQVNKWFRWLMGIPIAGIAIATGHGWWSLLAIVTYFVATNFFSYGDKMIWTKLFGKWVSMGLAGLAMGLASIVVLGTFWGIIQGIVGCISFLVLKWLDDTDRLKNPWQELLRGLLGTILFSLG
jgi:hypothetical protein